MNRTDPADLDRLVAIRRLQQAAQSRGDWRTFARLEREADGLRRIAPTLTEPRGLSYGGGDGEGRGRCRD